MAEKLVRECDVYPTCRKRNDVKTVNLTISVEGQADEAKTFDLCPRHLKALYNRIERLLRPKPADPEDS